MKCSVLTILLVCLIIYVVVGGVVFHFLDSEREESTREGLGKFREAFLANISCLSEEDLDRLITTVLVAYNQGVFTLSNTTSPSNWDIPSSIFFSTTVVTTIGYGHISPTHTISRMVFSLYAIIGIPLFLVVVAKIGSGQQSLLNSLLSRITKDWKSDKRKKITHIVVTLVLGLTIYIFIPALVFHVIESWTYAEGLYYCFVTLSTIGFGDYVPATEKEVSQQALYRILILVWMLLGLTWLSGIISSVQGLMETSIERADEKDEEQDTKYKAEDSEDPCHVLEENGTVTRI